MVMFNEFKRHLRKELKLATILDEPVDSNIEQRGVQRDGMDEQDHLDKIRF